ncbi:MAG: 2-oxoglutarate dehydrogenase E1 component [Spirochaetes bacterium]|nr:MAG: 2-oxoglutarate dehydrogenase E1 component [Spirochaetota bacterium]
MHGNSYEYLEELLAGEGDIERALANLPERYAESHAGAVPPEGAEFRQGRVDSLLWAYRDIGYLYANLNPLGRAYFREFSRLPEFQEETYHRLVPEEFGLTAADLDAPFYGGRYVGGPLPLREILKRFTRTYCSSVGVEFLHIRNKKIRAWLIGKIESSGNTTLLSREQRRTILDDLMKTEEMETFLHRTFLGQKRFSIQGADSLIPALHYLADSAHRFGIEEIVLGTSHRGRLSILNQILDQSPEDIFYMFEENFVPGVRGGSGDVRYHIGYAARHVNEDGTSVNITLLPNSSHLESVDAVVEGNARGLQDKMRDWRGERVMPVLLHGDASFSAQGVVAETFNLSMLKGYTTGGTIHIVVNNQIGYTTSPEGGRSGLHPTDIAKMIPVPIFHVNGDDPEAVLHVMRLALEYRREFHRDVVVDMYCYRRYGHNEGDEPSFTQPHMYELIKDHKGVTALYLERCIESGIVAEGEFSRMRAEYRGALAAALDDERRNKADTAADPGFVSVEPASGYGTAVDETILREQAGILTAVPPEFDIHPRLGKIIENNRTRFREEGLLDWGMAEALAFGTLLAEGVPIRLSGQDSERGTFSQRHLVWWEEEHENCCHYIPLAGLAREPAEFTVYNSPLSEYSVLGFEYGYALARRDALVIWEAQFGDFANGAQVMIDNYITAARAKWSVRNGLVMLLPHGYEGMGPEHSNAYLERYLSLCASENIRVAYPTTPAQYFHLLRLQKKNPDQRPLVVMTPKSLLRDPRAVSPIGDLSGGRFQRTIEDAPGLGIARLLFCTGKVYYDLLSGLEDGDRGGTGIVRVEQLYPFPEKEIGAALEKYAEATEYYWVQEEPRNRGAWRFIREHFDIHFPGIRLGYIGREASASPAAGSLRLHREEQQAIVAAATGGFKKAGGLKK